MNTRAEPGLVLVAHGTRSGKGVRMIAALAEAVALELGADGHRGGVRTAFVDVLGPAPGEVLRDLADTAPGPAVVVPAFLASGYHVYRDVPREVAESGHPAVTVTSAMGPDPAVARIMAMRLHAVGWRPGDAVVFAAAGSSDPRARADIRRAAAMLTAHLAAPVRTAYVATGAPRVPEVVRALRESGRKRVFIASYLLAHGLFQERLYTAGATAVADPIGVHPAVVRLIADRYRAAVRDLERVEVR